MEALFEVMPTQSVEEHEVKLKYTSAHQRDELEMLGYIPIDPAATSGYAVKVVRKIID